MNQLEDLFRSHHKELTRLAYNLLRDREAAKDVVQEVFFKLWKNRGQIDFSQPVKHYLFKATVHTSLNHLRSAKRLTPLDENVGELLVASKTYDDVDFTDFEQKVRDAIERLPAKCKTIYLLSRHEGLKYQEIADTLELSVKTVENQMGIALQKLRDDLKPFLSREFLTWVAIAAVGFLYLILKT
jgi:RNA polymerase sigma-70 factor (ECF subfamily)